MKKLEYKILLDNINKTKYIDIPIGQTFQPVDNTELIDDFADIETEKAIEPIIDNEVQMYNPSGNTVELNFKFYSEDYGSSGAPFFDNIFPYEGFRMTVNGFSEADEKTNGFKKSFFALEFFDTNNSNTNTILFTSTLPTVDSETGKPKDNADYILNSPAKDGYFLFYKRNKELIDTTGTTIYMKASFLNAKTGQIKKFANLDSDTTVPIDDYKDEMLYFKVRVYKDYIYQYFDKNDNPIDSLILRELVII